MNDFPHPSQSRALIGQPNAKTILDRLESEKPPHALLVAGEPSIGKATAAYVFAKILLSEKNDVVTSEKNYSIEGDNIYITETPSVRKIEQGAHPNVFILEKQTNPDTSKKYQNIRVEDVRSLKAFLQSTPAIGEKRIVILDATDDLNANAANALLKILEEPPAHVTFFLIAHRIGLVLPTIKSRTQKVLFSNVSMESEEKILKTIGVEKQPEGQGAIVTLEGIKPFKENVINALKSKTPINTESLTQSALKLSPDKAEVFLSTISALTQSAIHLTLENHCTAEKLERINKEIKFLHEAQEYNLDCEASLEKVFLALTP